MYFWCRVVTHVELVFSYMNGSGSGWMTEIN